MFGALGGCGAFRYWGFGLASRLQAVPIIAILAFGSVVMQQRFMNRVVLCLLSLYGWEGGGRENSTGGAGLPQNLSP